MSRRDPPHELAPALPGVIVSVLERVTGLLPLDTHSLRPVLTRPLDTRRSSGVAPSRQAKVERIHDVLEAGGGRIYQADVAAATDWSEATVSRTLGEMERSGAIVRIRDGRRKVVCYPDRVPDRHDSTAER